MQDTELQTQIIEEIKQIPDDKLVEIYDLIHYFRLGLNQEIQKTKPQNSFLETYINKPIKLNQFVPLNRDDIYER